MTGQFASMDAKGIYNFTAQSYYPQYGSNTETTEIVEEEFDGDGKLVSRKVTKTTKTVPNNNWQQYPQVHY